MDLGPLGGWGVGLAVGLIALYGLHRLALRLEERGHLYYRKTRPTRGAAGSFVALQRIVEPRAEHVLHIREEAAPRRPVGTGEGDDGPPPAVAPR